MMFCPQCGRSLNGESTCSFCAGGTGPSAQGAPSNYNASPYAQNAQRNAHGRGGVNSSAPSFVGAFTRFWTQFTEGRAGVLEFLYVHIWYILLSIPWALCIETSLGKILNPLFAIFSLAFLFKYIFLIIRRLHDRGMSGALVLMFIVPIANLVLFAMLLLPSQPGSNEYGRKPSRR